MNNKLPPTSEIEYATTQIAIDKERRFRAACAAMQGLLAADDGSYLSPGDVTRLAVQHADLLLARLDGKPKSEDQTHDR